MIKFFVYKITNLVNNKVYIGKSNTSGNRWKQHLRIAKYKYPGSYSYVHKSINKYGKENFLFEIIKYFDDENDAYNYETQLVSEYKSNKDKFGMNLNTGGRRSFRQNDEVKQKISKQRIGFKFSPDSLIRMSESHKGQIPVSRKFTLEQVFDIRLENARLKLAKFNNREEFLAIKYNVSRSCISKLLIGSNYASAKFPTIEINNDNRTCSVCKINKSKTCFYNRKDNKIYCRCKDCDKKCKAACEAKKPTISDEQKQKNRQRSLQVGLATLNDPVNRAKAIKACRKKKLNCANKFLGVYSKRDKFFASIRHNNKTYHLGTFTTANEAAKVRDQKALELLGSEAVLNFNQ